MSKNDCSSCRHHSKEERFKPTLEGDKVGFDDIIEIEDEKQIFFICKFGNRDKEVGTEPISCENWAKPSSNTNKADELLLRFENRTKTCGKCGSKILKPGPCPTCEDKPYG